MLQRVLSFDNSIKGVVGGRYTSCVGIGGGAAPFGDAVEKIGPMVRSFLLNIKMSENLTVTAAGAFGPDSYLKISKLFCDVRSVDAMCSTLRVSA